MRSMISLSIAFIRLLSVSFTIHNALVFFSCFSWQVSFFSLHFSHSSLQIPFSSAIHMGSNFPFIIPLFLPSFYTFLLHNFHIHFNFRQCFLPSALPFHFSLYPTPLLSLLIISTKSLNGSRNNSRMISNGRLPLTGPILLFFSSLAHKVFVIMSSSFIACGFILFLPSLNCYMNTFTNY